MRELAVQSLNGAQSDADRAALDLEVQQQLAEVQRMAQSTAFNGHQLLDGSAGSALFQIGADTADALHTDVSVDVRTDQIGAVALARSADLRTTNGSGGGGGFSFAGTYTTMPLSSLDFSRPEVNLIPGRATATPSVVNYSAAQAATFTVDDLVVSLTADYGNLNGVANEIQSQLNAARSGAYGVSVSGGQLTITKTSRASNPSAAVSMAAVSGVNATAFGNAVGTAGTQANTGGSLAFETLVNTLSSRRGDFGANLSRMEAIVGSLQSSSELIASSRGRIIDADYALETATLTGAQILRKAGMAMLAMANVGPRNVLALLRSIN